MAALNLEVSSQLLVTRNDNVQQSSIYTQAFAWSTFGAFTAGGPNLFCGASRLGRTSVANLVGDPAFTETATGIFDPTGAHDGVYIVSDRPIQTDPQTFDVGVPFEFTVSVGINRTLGQSPTNVDTVSGDLLLGFPSDGVTPVLAFLAGGDTLHCDGEIGGSGAVGTVVIDNIWQQAPVSITEPVPALGPSQIALLGGLLAVVGAAIQRWRSRRI